jgi:diadenosine tetraphosphate (Ap4A) HIT family hydrolase
MSVFNQIPTENIIFKGKFFFMIYDGYPVNPGHILIISNRDDAKDFFELTLAEKEDLAYQISLAKRIIEENHEPDGYNIGMNCGEVAGQTVPHFHCHVIPRYKGDMENPQGGVRHVIPSKGYYDKKEEPTYRKH